VATACGPAASNDIPEETEPPVTAAEAPTTTLSPTTTTETVIATTTTSTTVAPTTTTTTTTTTLPPVFAYSVEPVTDDVVWASWREDCPLHFSDLLLLTLTYWDFDGEVAAGQLAINAAVAEDVITAFEGLFEIGFPIERLQLVDDDGDDKAAMAANVTSGFNCRYVDGTDRWSNHAFGLAVDINPLINPWAREDNVLPLEGEPYTNRELDLPGMINLGDQAITVFQEVGWTWGGTWQSADYMHFSKPGN
jgi:hypothetical protein